MWCSTPMPKSKKRWATFFETFARTGSATATVRAFRQAGLLFPPTVGDRGAQRRAGLGPTAPQPCPTYAAEPPLYRGICLWAHAKPQAARGQGAAPKGPGTMAHSCPGRPSRLHNLGGLRIQPAPPARKREANGAGTPPEPTARRPGIATRRGRVRALWGADDRALLHEPRPEAA